MTDYRYLAETGSTNDAVRALARDGAGEGLWLRADRQTAGRGRQGRLWVSPVGNLMASTLVRLRPGDPPAPGLALVAGVALWEAVSGLVPPFVLNEVEGGRPDDSPEGRTSTALSANGRRERVEARLKWPNDLLLGGAKLGGILLEREGEAVIAGFGLNLAHHPDDLDRPATSLAAAIGQAPAPDTALHALADCFAVWLARWRAEGLGPILAAWEARAHPVGTPLSVHAADGTVLAGCFEGLEPSGALRLRLADGGAHVMHAGDVFLLRD